MDRDKIPKQASGGGSHLQRLGGATWVSLFIVLAFVALRLWRLDYYALTGDEIFSLTLARQGWGEMLSSAVRDVVHPPLFYILLKVWVVAGGESRVWLRLFPALTACAAIAPLYLLCKELGLRLRETNLALALAAFNGYMIFYAQDVRMYSLLTLTSTASLWLFVRFVNSAEPRKNLSAALFVANLLLVYTHYYAWLVVGVEFLYVLFFARKRLLSFAASCALLAACFAPWAFAVARAAAAKRGLGGNLGWNERPTFSYLKTFYGMLNGAFDLPGATAVGLLLFGVPIALLIRRALKRDDDGRARHVGLLALASFFPVALTFAASYLLPQSVWGERYLIIVAVPYFILVAIAVLGVGPRLPRTIALIAVLGWVAASCRAVTEDERKLRWDAFAQRIAQDDADARAEVKVYTLENFVTTPLGFYLDSAGGGRFQIVQVADADAAQGSHFWFAYRDTTWRRGQTPQQFFSDRGYCVGETVVSSAALQTIFVFPVWR